MDCNLQTELQRPVLSRATTGLGSVSQLTSAIWTASLFAGMFGVGVALASLGPTLLSLSERLDISLSLAAFIFTIRAAGYLLGALLCGKLLNQGHDVMIFLLPMVGACVGCFLIPSAHSFDAVCAMFFFQGLAMGVMDTGATVLLLDLWRGSRYLSGVVHALHFFFGLGAFVGPFFVSVWLQEGHTAMSAWTTIGFTFIPTCTGFLMLTCLAQPKHYPDSQGQDSVNTTVLVSGMFLFLDVGIEVAYGGYLGPFAEQWLYASPVSAAQLSSVYWGFLCIGRLVAAFVTPYVHQARYLAAHIGLGIIAMLILAFTTQDPADVTEKSVGWWVGVVAPSALFGFAVAPLFPGTMLMTEELLGSELTGRAATIIVVMGAVGEMACPLVVGQVFAVRPSFLPQCCGLGLLMSAALFFTNGGNLLKHSAKNHA